MRDREIATAADYADALLTTRRAKHALSLLLLLLILGQLAVFFIYRYTDFIPSPTVATEVSTEAATQPAASKFDREALLHWVSGGCLFLGLTVSILLSFVLLLIVNIMLVGRLIGVGRLVSAYCWCLVLVLVLFPWQAFLNNVQLDTAKAHFKLPGVLYTWDELTNPSQPGESGRFQGDWTVKSTAKWVRYVGAPVMTLIILLVIQGKSNRGLRQALGEDDFASTSEDQTDA
jgi:hypothetical protein